MILFENREEAGKRLALKLKHYQGRDVLVLAIPRGGVEVAAQVARLLNAPLDVIIPRKVGAPGDPELAVGAVTPDGYVLWNLPLLQRLGLTEDEMQPRVAKTREEIQRRLKAYRGEAPPPVFRDRVVILVDDGIATGFTVKAALRAIARQHPSRTVLAVPVGPEDTLAEMAYEVDELVYVAAPEPFLGVGQFYREFPQTPDAEVKRLLQCYGAFRSAGPPALPAEG